MPSITYSGSLVAVIELEPRTWIEMPPPGAPLFCVTWAPATRPCRICPTFCVCATGASSTFTDATLPVTSCRRCVP